MNKETRKAINNMPNPEIFIKRLRDAKVYLKKAERLQGEYKDTWSTKKFMEKMYPTDYKSRLKLLEKNAEPLRVETVCMGCGKEDINRLGTLTEMCDDCVVKTAENFGKVTILQGRLHFDTSNPGIVREGKCDWCDKRTKRVYMINVYMCPTCMRRMSHVS